MYVRRMKKKYYIILLSVSFLLNSCQSQEKGLTKNERIDLFDRVWNIVNDQFYDPNFNGVDWGERYIAYKPLIEQMENSDTLFFLLNKMLFELNSSHCGIGLLSELDNVISPYIFKNGVTGIDIRIIDDQIVVTKVLKSSSADIAKIKTGYIIEKIDDSTIEDIEEFVVHKPPFNERNKKFHLTIEVLRHIYGQAGTKVKIDFLDETNQAHSELLIREERKKGMSLVGGLPPAYLNSESYYLSEDIAYLSFNAFNPPDLEHILNNLEKVFRSKGLIIDLRGNDGGSFEGMKLLLSRFVSENKKYGTYINRNERNEDIIESIGTKYQGEIVMLVDEMSI